jgi:hypothetical protein
MSSPAHLLILSEQHPHRAMAGPAFPLLLRSPTRSGVLPCFGFRERGPRRPRWNARCTSILVAMGEGASNAEIAERIAAETGLRFGIHAISRHRALLGVAAGGPQRNDWTSPLRRWKPWQGHLARKR